MSVGARRVAGVTTLEWVRMRRLIRLPEDRLLVIALLVLGVIIGLFAWQAVSRHT